MAKATQKIEEAAAAGSQLVLIQELFAGLYFCQQEDPAEFSTARPANLEQNELLRTMSALAKANRIILPVSFFEKSGHVYFNSIVVFDADGSIIGAPPGETNDCSKAIYRKVHIPTGPGYQEKYYFSPAPAPSPSDPEAGFRVFYSKVYDVTIGIGICWDQWFPETARCLALAGAEIILYPTAIGSEPQDPTINSRDHWQRVMCGHAGANLVPVVASNRIGKENEIRFYGSSFISDHTGRKLQEADEETSSILHQQFDLDKLQMNRSSWGLFRDRRPEVYGAITTLNAKPLFSRAREPQIGSTSSLNDFVMPAEWATHERCWMIWLPDDSSVWHANSIQDAQKEFAAVANAIAEFEPVSMCVAQVNYEVARKLVSDKVTLVPVAHDDCWARDSMPTYVQHHSSGKVAGIDWIFNGYSGKFSHENDAILARTILAMQGKERFACPMILEGGSIHTDGEGTLITTEECLLKRNPQLTKSDMETQLKMYLGVQKIIWIPEGVINDDDTDGHVDNLCCFARPGEVVLTFPSDANSIQRARSEKALAVLNASTDAKGRALKVHLLEHPKPVFIVETEMVPGLRELDRPLAASYINYYMTNGAIVMPSYENGQGLDEVAKNQLQAIFPDRKIVPVSSRLILCGGGNIHCITQQQPASP